MLNLKVQRSQVRSPGVVPRCDLTFSVKEVTEVSAVWLTISRMGKELMSWTGACLPCLMPPDCLRRRADFSARLYLMSICIGVNLSLTLSYNQQIQNTDILWRFILTSQCLFSAGWTVTKWINIFSKNISYNIKFSQWDVNQLPLDYRTNAMTTELHTPKIYNTMHIYRQIDDHLIRGVEIPMYTYS